MRMLIYVSSSTEVRWHYGMWDTPHSYHVVARLPLISVIVHYGTGWSPCGPTEIIVHAHEIPTNYVRLFHHIHPSILCLLFSLARSFFITIMHASSKVTQIKWQWGFRMSQIIEDHQKKSYNSTTTQNLYAQKSCGKMACWAHHVGTWCTPG